MLISAVAKIAKMSERISGSPKAASVLLISALLSQQSLAVVSPRHKKPAEHWTKDSAELKISLRLNFVDRLKKVTIPRKKIVLRAKKAESDDRIDPIQLRIPTNHKKLADYVLDLAKRKYRQKVYKYFLTQITDELDQKTQKIELNQKVLGMLKIDQLAQKLAHSHHDITLKTKGLLKDQEKVSRFLGQLRPFLSVAKKRKISRLIQKQRPVNVDKLLLPAFAQKMVEKFTIFRGPNCFHAALAFHDRRISNSPWFNVKKEKGYHRSMINYDELWRTLNSAFYEVDPRKDEVEYGDILVFFDVPSDYREGPVNFKWIRHTAAYLFDRYTFSKGSKSPDTPYTIKTLDEEWTTWRRYTKNLGVKVYRRSLNHGKKRPPKDLTDWLY